MYSGTKIMFSFFDIFVFSKSRFYLYDTFYQVIIDKWGENYETLLL